MDFLVWLATFLGCLFISIDAGLGIGIALGLLFLFVRTAFPRIHILRRLSGTSFFRDADMYRLQVSMQLIQEFHGHSLHPAACMQLIQEFHGPCLHPAACMQLIHKFHGHS